MAAGAGEDIVFHPGVEGRLDEAFLLELEGYIAGLPAPPNGVDRPVEGTHAVVVLGRGRSSQPKEPSARAMKPSALVAIQTLILRLRVMAGANAAHFVVRRDLDLHPWLPKMTAVRSRPAAALRSPGCWGC
jgi:hypothetical protein